MISFDEALARNDARLLAHRGTPYAPLREPYAEWARHSGMAAILFTWSVVLMAAFHAVLARLFAHTPDYTELSCWGCAWLLGMMAAAITFDLDPVNNRCEQFVGWAWRKAKRPLPLQPHQVRWMIEYSQHPGTMAGEAVVRWLAGNSQGSWTQAEWYLLRSWQRKREQIQSRQRELMDRDERAREAMQMLDASGLLEQARALQDRQALLANTPDPPAQPSKSRKRL